MAVAAARAPPASVTRWKGHRSVSHAKRPFGEGAFNRKDERMGVPYEIEDSSRINHARVTRGFDRRRTRDSECGTAAQARVRLSKQYNRWGQWRDIYELSSTGAAGLFENALDPVRSSLHHVFGSSRYT